MGTSSLILGIVAFLVSLSIFKDLALILAILSAVLGIISLCKKKNKGLSIAGIILAIVSLIVLFSTGNTTEVSKTTSNNADKSLGIQNCKIGDTITVKNGADDYTLQITGVTESTDRNEFADEKPKQVFLIDYNYLCNNTDSGLYISDMNFKIIDEQGEIGYIYPIDTKEPQNITSGVSCKAQMAFGVNNTSKKIKLQFFDNMFYGKPTAIYEIEL